MKHQFFLGFVLCCCASYLSLAQTPVSKDLRAEKPSLFANLPMKSVCNCSELEKLYLLSKSDQTSLTLAHHFVVSGEVIEKVETSAGTKNVNMRLSNFGDALLNISFIKQQDGHYKFTGRIIHPKNAEALVIAEENGKYYITKHKMEFFMVD